MRVPMCAMLSHFSRVQLFATLQTVTFQGPLSMEILDKNSGVGCHDLLMRVPTIC